jgi:hypothetical protein
LLGWFDDLIFENIEKKKKGSNRGHEQEADKSTRRIFIIPN